MKTTTTIKRIVLAFVLAAYATISFRDVLWSPTTVTIIMIGMTTMNGMTTIMTIRDRF